MQPETLITPAGVSTFPAPRDPATAAVLARARDLIAANVMWGYVLEVARAGCPVTVQTLHDVAEGVRLGTLPDRAFSPVSMAYSPA